MGGPAIISTERVNVDMDASETNAKTARVCYMNNQSHLLIDIYMFRPMVFASYIIFIYTGECEWSEWEHGKCSSSCGTGIQEKRRYRRNGVGERCGMDEEVVAKPCINSVCPRIGNL